MSAAIDLKDYYITNGATELHLAAMYGRFDEVVKLLEQRGSTRMADENGQLPIHYAATTYVAIQNPKNPAAMHFNKDDPDSRNIVLEHLVLADPDSVNIADNRGITALHLAATLGLVQTAECLVAYGAEVYAHDKKFNTAADLAEQYGKYKTAIFLRKEMEIQFKLLMINENHCCDDFDQSFSTSDSAIQLSGDDDSPFNSDDDVFWC